MPASARRATSIQCFALYSFWREINRPPLPQSHSNSHHLANYFSIEAINFLRAKKRITSKGQ